MYSDDFTHQLKHGLQNCNICNARVIPIKLTMLGTSRFLEPINSSARTSMKAQCSALTNCLRDRRIMGL